MSTTKTTAKPRKPRGRTRLTRPRADGTHSLVLSEGRVTHVLVPIEEYEGLMARDLAVSAVPNLGSDENAWIDADEYGLTLAARSIAQARKSLGLTQKALAQRVGVPQSMISRIERRPDHTTVRTLKRIAQALGIDVKAFL